MLLDCVGVVLVERMHRRNLGIERVVLAERVDVDPSQEHLATECISDTAAFFDVGLGVERAQRSADDRGTIGATTRYARDGDGEQCASEGFEFAGSTHRVAPFIKGQIVATNALS